MASLGDQPLQRLSSGYDELDRVLGGGLVPGSLVLVGETLASAKAPCFCRVRRPSPATAPFCM